MKYTGNYIVLLVFLILSCSRETHNHLQGTPAEIPAKAISPLETQDDLDLLLEEIGDARIVLLGEASHGTSEFYTWRDSISRRLIEEKDFRIIAVEGDWEDAYPLNEYIRGKGQHSSAVAALAEFNRWPQWMWANEEIANMGEWLRIHNSGREGKEQVGFYGLDVYGIWESIDAVFSYLQNTDPEAADVAQKVLDCFAPYNRDEDTYMRASLNSSQGCAAELEELLEVVSGTVGNRYLTDEVAFNALQNAQVAVNAEKYYRIAPRSGAQSWNIRDRHMMATINRLLEAGGTGAKIIIWEHNTHVGDARATDMARSGMVNVGQLAREHYGLEEVYIIGFGTYRGKVMAARSWGGIQEVMNVPKGRRNSWEWILHNHQPANKIILTEPLGIHDHYKNPVDHRAIGVVYDPGSESGNYVPSVIPGRYDAFIFIDRTTAVKPLE